jgi:hypothetical protein
MVLAWAFEADLVDDTYIFLRYARNMAEGHGAVFNVGERIEGYSSPLWTFLLGGAGVVFPDFETLAYVMGLACGAAVVGLLVVAVCGTGRLGGWDAVILGLGLATSPVVAFWSGSGMDAPLFLLLTAASLLSILKDRNTSGLSARTTVLLTLATLTRPEGVLLAAYAGAYFLWERRGVRTLLGYAAAVATLFVARYAYYGAWVPNTYHAKVTFDAVRRLHDGAAYIGLAAWTHGPLLCAAVMMLVFAWRRRTLSEVPLLFLGGWIVLWSGYVLYVGGDNFAAFRFLLPTLPAWFLLLGWGWASIRDHLRPATRGAFLAVLLAAFSIAHAHTYHSQARHCLDEVHLARCWAKVGRWLAHNTPPNTVIATVVPGALGYHSRRAVIDMLGLTDGIIARDGEVYPQAAHGHGRYHTDYVFRRNPDIVVYHSSGRFREPVYHDAKRIAPLWGYALFDFVTDPRCEQRYSYRSTRLPDGTVVEMMMKRTEAARLVACATGESAGS